MTRFTCFALPLVFVFTTAVAAQGLPAYCEHKESVLLDADACLETQIEKLENTAMSPTRAADRTMAACAPKEKALVDIMMKCHRSDVVEAIAGLRNRLIDKVVDYRKRHGSRDDVSRRH